MSLPFRPSLFSDVPSTKPRIFFPSLTPSASLPPKTSPPSRPKDLTRSTSRNRLSSKFDRLFLPLSFPFLLPFSSSFTHLSPDLSFFHVCFLFYDSLLLCLPSFWPFDAPFDLTLDDDDDDGTHAWTFFFPSSCWKDERGGRGKIFGFRTRLFKNEQAARELDEKRREGDRTLPTSKSTRTFMTFPLCSKK